jgi:hypothetical protein
MPSCIIPEKNAVYLAIDKNASGTMRRLLQKYYPAIEKIRYKNASEAPSKEHFRKAPKIVKFSHIKSLYPDHFTFTFIRNPYDRAISYYFHKTVYKAFDTKHREPGMSFEEFLHFRKNNKIPLMKQSWWFDVPFEDIDFVGRFENLQNDLYKVCEILKMEPITLTIHAHQTPRESNYRQYYNPITRKMVERMFAEDFEKFDYTF